MAKKTNSELPRRSTGTRSETESVEENLKPTGGYNKSVPVQYSDETDEQFAKRVEDFETRQAHAEEIENAGDLTQDSYEGRKARMEERHERERAALEALKPSKK